jgi:hypothetical protein
MFISEKVSSVRKLRNKIRTTVNCFIYETLLTLIPVYIYLGIEVYKLRPYKPFLWKVDFKLFELQRLRLKYSLGSRIY